MAIKILPINIPPIIGRLHNTYPLIVMLNHKECLPWFYSNYIQLYCNKKINYNNDTNLILYYPNANLDLKFYLPDDVEWRFDYPCLDIQVINIKAFPRCNIKLVDFLLDCIDQEYYIKIDLDDFYIPNKSGYNKQHMRHLNFIYGYDDDNKLFYTVGFDQNQNYVESTVPFKAIENGYEEVENAYIKIHHKKVRSPII